MKALLDTNIWRKPTQVLDRFTQFTVGELGISLITAAELAFGAERSQRREQNHRALDQFLLPLVVVKLDLAASLVYGWLRARLERHGAPLGALDTFIAANALYLDVPLVTNDTRELARVADLRLENWVAEGTGS